MRLSICKISHRRYFVLSDIFTRFHGFGGNKWTRTTDKIAYVGFLALFPRPFGHIYPFSRVWWEQVDSNHRPHAYQACALTSWAMFPNEDKAQKACLSRPACLKARRSVERVHLQPLGWMVEVSGIEPLTPCLQGRCSPSWATHPCITCLYRIPFLANYVKYFNAIFCKNFNKFSGWYLAQLNATFGVFLRWFSSLLCFTQKRSKTLQKQRSNRWLLL